MSLVRGDNVILEFFDSGQWKIYACARSCSFVTITDIIETTVTGSGKYKHFVPTVNSFTGQCEGLVSLGDAGILNLYNLRQFQLGHVLQRARFTRTAIDGTSIYVDTVDFYITSITDTASFDNVATFNIEMQGIGVPGQSLINPPVNADKMKRYEYTATGGETGFTNAALINKDIIAVHKDGTGNSKLKMTGVPASKEVVYTSSTGHFEWAVQWEPAEEGYILYQNL
jgi:hypothetical protein